MVTKNQHHHHHYHQMSKIFGNKMTRVARAYEYMYNIGYVVLIFKHIFLNRILLLNIKLLRNVTQTIMKLS